MGVGYLAQKTVFAHNKRGFAWGYFAFDPIIETGIATEFFKKSLLNADPLINSDLLTMLQTTPQPQSQHRIVRVLVVKRKIATMTQSNQRRGIRESV